MTDKFTTIWRNDGSGLGDIAAHPNLAVHDAVYRYPIQGAKKGQGKQRTPKIADDTVASISKVKILYGLSEGEVKGLKNGAASIMLDGTPLTDDNGVANFENVEWEIRTGTPEQSHIAGMPSTSQEIAINTALRSGTPYVRSLADTSLSSVNINVSWGLLKEAKDNGDIVGVTVDYAIDVQTDGNGYQTLLNTSIKAKTSGRYQRTHNIKLPDAEQGWQIRVRKLTADGDNERTFNDMRVDSIAEIVDAKLRYPSTALLYLSFDAQTFSNIPKLSVRLLGRYVQVPSNYDTETRTSNGLWNGTFKQGYTNNPAWVYYDLITNDRYGLGDTLKAFMIDKWALEHIARVCDEPVDDGKGGLEPRFTCNLYIQKQEDAYQVLQHIAGIFRGLSFWNGSQIVVDADTPRDAAYVITAANVVGGEFVKSGSSAHDRHTIAKVAWSNPDNAFETEHVMVRNERAIAQQGIKIVDISAVGCTSEGQAYRMGLAALLAEQNRTQTVSFSMGLDGQLPTVGERVDIADMMFTGANNSGRIASVSTDFKTLVLDRAVQAQVGDELIVNLESGKAQTRIIASIADNTVTVSQAFDAVARENVWAVNSDEMPTMPFIVMSIVAEDDGTQYSYTAMQYDASMYAQIDNGTIIEQRPVVPTNNPYVIQAPDDVTLSSRHRVVQGLTVATLVIAWAQVKDAVAYDVEWRKDDGDWIKIARTGNISAEIDGVYAGNYLARVRAVSAFDAISKPTTSMLTAISGKQGLPPTLTQLKATGVLFGVELSWVFASGSTDAAYTEIETASAPEVNVALLGQYSYPTDTTAITGLQGGLTRYYRARIVDKLGFASEFTAWQSATTDNSADKVLDLVQGKITGSSLDTALTTKIDKIGVVEQDLSDETNARIQDIIDTKQAADDAQQAADSAQQAASSAATLAGNKGEVIYQTQTPAEARRLTQNLWIDTTGGKNTPKRWNGSAWVAVTDKAAVDAQAAADDALDKANKANQSVVTILDEQEIIKNDLGVQVETLQGVIADYKPRYTDASRKTDVSRSQNWTYAKSVSNNIYAANERITLLKSELDDSDASVRQEIESLATNDAAFASSFTQLAAQTGENTGLIQDLELAITTPETGLAAKITNLQSNFEGDNLATLVEGSGAFSDEFGSISGQYTTMQGVVDGQQTSIEVASSVGDLNKLKNEIAKARIDKDVIKLQAQSDALTAKMSAYDDKIAEVNAKKSTATDSAIIALYDEQIDLLNAAKTDANTQKSAITSQVTQLNDEKTELESLVLTESKVKAQYYIKLDSGGVVSGYGLLQDNSGNFDFAVRADKFYIAPPANGVDDGVSPFMVLTSPTTIDGVTVEAGTYARNFYAPKASIDTIQIKDAAVKSAQIDDLAVTTGKIANLAVDTLQIKGNAVIVPRVVHNPNTVQCEFIAYGSDNKGELIASASVDAQGGSVTSSIYFEFMDQTTAQSNSPQKLIELRLYEGANLIKTWYYEFFSGYAQDDFYNQNTAPHLHNPSSGMKTYSVYIRPTSGHRSNVKIKGTTLHLQGAKR